ncbi:hypothetical protein QQX09_03580 [Demequina sp. SYSU T00192]|uniref:DUF4328 domain-containing protein n=1 Tax=Demequina litoralis TaxID=3051660 RepID=A0ABT8G8C4_9MICO|nr:hypothetical protein [Demequina sp. SYSU T00192]MDN4474934.1 hypothetical protein [Demequina sp. SYSU T00192]
MTNEDPFAARPGRPEEPPRPPASSDVPGPGLIPGAAPPPAPVYGTGPQVRFDRTGAPLEKPEGLAKGLIGVAAGFTLVSVLMAVFAQGDVDAIRAMAESNELQINAGSLLSLLTTPLLVVSYILYGMWMSRMRRNREALGVRPGMGAVEWWGWFIPIASVVLIPIGARKVTGRGVGLGLLLGWWITWILAQGVQGLGSAALQFSLDLTTGELAYPERLDAYPAIMWASAALVVISFVFFMRFIRAATDRHVEIEA